MLTHAPRRSRIVAELEVVRPLNNILLSMIHLLALSAPSLCEAVLFWGLFFIPIAILHLILSSAVFSDARRLKTHLSRSTFLVGPSVWWFATLLGGIVTVAIYWTIHHSRLRSVRHPN